MNEIEELIAEVARARGRVVDCALSLDPEVAFSRPSANDWCVAEVVEHLVLAERYGIQGLWGALERVAEGVRLTKAEPARAALSVDQIFSGGPRRLDAPDAVWPGSGGRPLGYWAAELRSNQALLEQLGRALAPLPLEEVIYPHFLAGPLNGRQRLQFLRWHLDRHWNQIQRILGEPTPE